MADKADMRARMAAALNSIGGEQQAQEAPKVARRVKAEAQETAAGTKAASQQDTDIQNNPVYKIMADGQRSNDQKITQIAKYLTTENEDYSTARKHFAAFEAYFNHVQRQGMELDLKGIETLIEEVRNALKPAIEKIVKDVVEVQKGVDESRHLLEVMRAARLEGKTIDQIKEAVELNDKIIAEITAITQSLEQLQRNQASRQDALNQRLDAKIESEKGFPNTIARFFTGPDKAIARQIDDSSARLEEVKAELERTQQALKDKESERNTNLESGPLIILRSIDATDSGFSDNIINTATHSLELIAGASASIQELLKRTAYSKESARDINESISQAEIREAVLKGAVQHVVKASHDQSEVIKNKLIAQDEKIAQAGDEIEKATLNADRVGMAEQQKAALDYEDVLNRALADFGVISANTVEARSRAREFSDLVQTEEDLLKRLNTEALPATARALRMVLEQDVSVHTAELAVSIREITAKARQTGAASLEHLQTTQKEVREQELIHMQDAIDALNKAEETLVESAEATVQYSRKRAPLTEGLTKAASELHDVLEQYDVLRADAADPKKAADPARPASTNGSGAKNPPPAAVSPGG